MPSPMATGNGPSVVVAELHEKTLQLLGTFNAQIQVAGSLDGSDFDDLLGTPLSAHAIVEISEAVKYLRVRVVTYVSGAPVLLIGGFNSRTDT